MFNMTQIYITNNEDGKFYFSDKEKTILHREDGPAMEYNDGTNVWCLNNQYHRVDGPAVELSCGSKFWYLNGQCHRDNAPAVEYADGTKHWYRYGYCYNTSNSNYTQNKQVEYSGSFISLLRNFFYL